MVRLLHSLVAPAYRWYLSSILLSDGDIDRVHLDVRVTLQKYPAWLMGHLELGSHSLENQDLKTAYASARAALKISNSDRTTADCLRLLGKTYLRSGQPKEALGPLQESNRLAPGITATLEELGAVYMALGEFGLAHKQLLQITDSNRTAETNAAIAFTERKLLDSNR